MCGWTGMAEAGSCMDDEYEIAGKQAIELGAIMKKQQGYISLDLALVVLPPTRQHHSNGACVFAQLSE